MFSAGSCAAAWSAAAAGHLTTNTRRFKLSHESSRGKRRMYTDTHQMSTNAHTEGRVLWRVEGGSRQNCRRQSALNFTPPLINPPHFLSSVFSLPLLVAKLLPGCECVCVCVWWFGTSAFSLREVAAVVGLPAKGINACNTRSHTYTPRCYVLPV